MGVAEELRNADLLRERGDLMIKQNERLDEAEACFKKVPSPFLLVPSLLVRCG
jgi:hypothetical protein